MPRYLSIDYHKELLQERRNLLQRIFILLPSVEGNKISAHDVSCSGAFPSVTVSDQTRLSITQNDIGNDICVLRNHIGTNPNHLKEFEKTQWDSTDLILGDRSSLYKSRTEKSLCFETLESINTNDLDTQHTYNIRKMIRTLDLIEVPDLRAEAVEKVTSNTKLETLERFPDMELGLSLDEPHKKMKEQKLDIESDDVIFSGESIQKDMKQMLRDVTDDKLDLNRAFKINYNPQMPMLSKPLPKTEQLEKIDWVKEKQEKTEIFLDQCQVISSNVKCVQELDLYSQFSEEQSPLKTATKDMKLCGLPLPLLSNADMKGLLDTTEKSVHPSELELELSTGLRLNRISISEAHINRDSQLYKPQTMQETMRILCIQQDVISQNLWLSLPWNLTRCKGKSISNKPEALCLSICSTKMANIGDRNCTVVSEDFRRCPECERSPEQSFDSQEKQVKEKCKKFFPSKKKMLDAVETFPFGSSTFGDCESSRYGLSSISSTSPPRKTIRTNTYCSTTEGVKNQGSDSLSAFLELRGQKTKYKVPNIQEIKETKSKEQSKTAADKETYPMVAAIAMPKDKGKLVKVYLSADITKLVYSAKLKADGIIKELKKRKFLPEKCDFYSLSQEESKSYTSHIEKYARENRINVDTYPPFVYHFILECLVCCVHLLVNISAPSALAYMINIYQANKSQLESSCLTVESFKEFSGQLVQTTEYAARLIPQLIKELQGSCSQMTPHPKMMKTREIIMNWMHKKIKKYVESDPKVLIQCPANCDYLLGEIASFLSQDVTAPNSVHFPLYPVLLEPSLHSKYIQSKDVMELLSSGNIAVVSEAAISDDFPWKHFSLLIEYAAAESSSLEKKASHLNTRYFGLQAERPSIITGICDDNEATETYEQMTLIGSSMITHSGKLLHLLEARYNIIIIERNYQLLLMKNRELTSHNLINHHPDIILDESVCILLEKYIPSMDTKKTEKRNSEAEKLAARLIGIHLKFTKCYLVVWNPATEGDTNCSKADFYLHVADVYSSVKAVLQENADFEVKVFCAYDVDEIAFLIRNLADHCRETSKTWTKERWIQRSWLSAGVSTHEKFLLQFPCINAFVAQLLLTVAPLKCIVGQEATKIQEKCPWIPSRIIHNFCNILGLTSFSSPYYHTEISDVDVTPNFNFSMRSIDDKFDQKEDNFGNQLWTTGPSHDYNFTNIDKKQYNPSNEQAKTLTFERVKGRKDGQTRLTFC